MYSHDTYGLGHIRRTMAIASHLKGPRVNVLILTGSPIAGRYSFPDRVDFVRIPGMIKKTNEEYQPLSIKIDPGHALEIRKNIITATAKTFQPHLFIVDKEPLGLNKEVLPTLQWLRKALPETRTILGLRDIMDSAETVKQAWKKKGVYEILDSLYSEIWVYGIREFYNPIKEYDIPDTVSKKIHFTGYIPRKKATPSAIRKIREDQHMGEDDKLIVVTAGGGGDGFAMVDKYLSMLETEVFPFRIKTILVTGPFMPEKKREEVVRRARQLKIKTHRFYRKMVDMLAASDLVISMGGYNTVCEIMTQGSLCLLIPRETPREEQLLRAQVFHRQNLLDYISWKEVSPGILRDKVISLLDNSERYKDAVSQFQMTGFDVMRQRLSAFRNGDK